MLHGSGLIATITLGLVAALGGGLLAVRLRLPPIVGYLLAGIGIGPFTPGFVGSAAIATELASRGLPVHLTTTDPAAHVAMTLETEVPGLKVQRGRAAAHASAAEPVGAGPGAGARRPGGGAYGA